MAVISAPVVPVGQKPTPSSWLGPSSVPGHWWDGLKMCFPIWEGVSEAAGATINLATAERSGAAVEGVASSDIFWTHSDEGLALEISHKQSHFKFDLATVDNRLLTAGTNPGTGYAGFTFAIYAFQTAVSTNNPNVLSDNEYFIDGVRHGCWAILQNNGTDCGFQIGYGDNGGGAASNRRHINTGSIVPLNEWHMMSGSMTGNTTGRLYIDGIERAINSTAGTGGAVGYDATLRHTLGDADNSDLGVNARIAVAYAWARELSSSEHKALADDPYAPIRSYMQIHIPEAAGAPPVVTAVRRHLMMMGMGR